jgi:hypothetical protein
VGHADTWCLLLRAAVASRRQRLGERHSLLEAAIRSARLNDLPHCEQAARFRLGSSLGGDAGAALQAQALAWFALQQIQNPERMLEVWAPGFD